MFADPPYIVKRSRPGLPSVSRQDIRQDIRESGVRKLLLLQRPAHRQIFDSRRNLRCGVGRAGCPGRQDFARIGPRILEAYALPERSLWRVRPTRNVLEQHPDTEFERSRTCCRRDIAPPATNGRLGFRPPAVVVDSTRRKSLIHWQKPAAMWEHGVESRWGHLKIRRSAPGALRVQPLSV